jgi:preprotein translocase subunit YajC
MSRILFPLALVLVASLGVAVEGGPQPAPAPAAPGAPGSAPPASPFDGTFFILIIGMILFMWLLVIRPQRREEKRRKELIESMKPGHQVVTIGGIHGEVLAVGEQTVDLNVARGGEKPFTMTFNRGAIATNTTLLAEASKPAAK